MEPAEIFTENSAYSFSQGADFIHDCLNILLNRPEERYEQLVDIREYRVIGKIRKDLKSLLETAFGSNYKCLIHLDEHYQKYIRDDPATANKANFSSKGVKETLSQIEGVPVIATYVGGVPVSSERSSKVCRLATMYPLGLLQYSASVERGDNQKQKLTSPESNCILSSSNKTNE